MIDPLPNSHKEKTEESTEQSALATRPMLPPRNKRKKPKNRLPHLDDKDEYIDEYIDDDIEYGDDDDNENLKDVDVEDEADFDYAGAMQSMSSILAGAMSTITRYIPSSIPFLGRINDFNFQYDNDIDEPMARSTTPRGELRKPKKPLVQFYEDDYVNDNVDDNDKLNRWYNPFMYLGDDAAMTTAAPTSTEASFFNWFGSGDDPKEPVTETATEANSSKCYK